MSKYLNGDGLSHFMGLVKEGIGDAVDAIEVGGRNLLLGTADGYESSINYYSPYPISDAVPMLASDDVLTISFEAKASESRWIDFYWNDTTAQSGGTSYNNNANFYEAFQLTTDWARYTYTGAAGTNVANAKALRFRQSSTKHGASAAGVTIFLRSVKLEKGNKATDWSPAPEDTTYSAGTGLSLASTTFNHSNSVTAGTAGTSSATSGRTLAIPYVTYDAQGHVTASGTHTHTVSGFNTTHYVGRMKSMANNLSGKYIKISINSYTNWMLSFVVRIYCQYRAADISISGYNYAANHWYMPRARIQSDSENDSIIVTFGYDSDYHLWVAFPAKPRYNTVEIYDVVSGYADITIDGNLFTIELVDGLPTTSQVTATAYSPFLKSETIPASNGGTGQTSLVNSANALINALTTGSSDPVDADYYVSQYVGGGTSTTTFQRRPMSALWNYVKGKISSVLGLTATSYGGNAATATSAGNVTGTVAIANGGTGATTAAAARTSLGAQATLVSGTNIKTINNSSILGSGNLTITGGGNMFYGWLMTPVSDAAASIVCPEFTSSDLVAGTVLHVVLDMGVTLSIGPNSTLNVNSTGAFKVITDVEYTAMPYCFSESIATFVYYDDPDGVNHGWMIPTAEYKTVNGTSVLGTGDIAVQPTLVSGTNIKTVNGSSLLGSGDIGVQPTLVSGTNIKTVNGASILGSGDVSAQSTWYGTCSTAAATADKAVTCSGFSLTAGAMVSVLFTTANTAATPTLNVNSTGAKAVYVGSGAINATTNTLKWSANTLLTFVYDGTGFRYLGSQAAATLVPPEGAGAWYGTCATAESTAAKATTIANFRLVPGAIVNVTFTTASTVSGAITLNVNSTGAKTVYYNNIATSASNPLTWTANQTLTFVYSGSYWHYLGRSGLEEDMPSGGPSGSDSWTDVTSQFVAEDASWSAYMTDLQVLRSSTMVAINGHALGSGTPLAVPTVGRPECPTSLSIPAAISDFGPILTAGANVPSLYYSGTWLFDDGGYTGDFQLVYPLYSE